MYEVNRYRCSSPVTYSIYVEADGIKHAIELAMHKFKGFRDCFPISITDEYNNLVATIMGVDGVGNPISIHRGSTKS